MSSDEQHNPPEEDDLEQKIGDAAKIGLPLVTVLGAAAAGAVQGPPAAILVLAGGTLVAVIALFWSSVRTLAGETPLAGADAYALGAPRAEEEQKRAVLRALKDLEFERNVGKISEEDYAELVAKYRAEAKRLLRILEEDAAPRREQIEALVLTRLAEEGLVEVTDEASTGGYRDAAKSDKRDKESKREKSAPPKKAKAPKKERIGIGAPSESDEEEPRPLVKGKLFDMDAPLVCSSCGTQNDADAVFCKKCGMRRGAPAPDDDAPDDDAASDDEATREAKGEKA
jgi:ribosomal protein L40E